MGLYKSLLVILYLIFGYTAIADSFTILGILPTDHKSHYIFGSALMRALAQKGHEVHVIAPFKQELNMSNYHEILLENQQGRAGVTDFSEGVLTEPNVQQLMVSNHTFDVVICEVHYSEALFGLSEHFGAPLIGLSTAGSILWTSDMVGSPSPPAFVPSYSVGSSDRMSLIGRVVNQAYISWEWLSLRYYHLRPQAALYAKYFPHLKRDMYTVRKNAALVFVNTHISMSYPRPYMPNHIEVAGMHISRKPLRKSLPTDMEKFIQGAEDGVVYFSFGSKFEGRDLQETKKKEFLEALGKLKQRVLWKYEDAVLEGKPENVYISDWFPQDDVLAHENVKAFITYGGLLSITESIYHGKPMVGISGDVDLADNLARIENLGIGIQVHMKSFKAQDLVDAVERVINDKSYTERVQNMSAAYKDQPVEPVDLAVFWVEHVVRRKGAKYLHCAGLNLNFFQYHSIDVISTLACAVLFCLYLIYILPTKIVERYSP